MIIKKFNIDFKSHGGALTLDKEEIYDISLEDNRYMKTHNDDWTIIGELHEDYYEWVNEFIAIHPKHGKVWGNFEEKVYADNELGYYDFYNKHTPQDWDYGDI